MKLNVTLKDLPQGATIDSIEVPAHMRRRISFGVDWVDELFASATGNGAVPSTAILFTGTPGAGKTTLSLQLANAISQREDAIVLFNTREESLFQTKMQSERMNLNSRFYVGQDELVGPISNLENPHLWKGQASSIVDHAKFLMDENPGKDFFLMADSLQTFNDGKYGPGNIIPASQVRVVEQLTDFCKQGYNGVYPILVLVGQVTKSGEFAGKNTVKHAVDAHMHLYIDDDKKSDFYGQRILGTSKNRFGSSGKQMILGMGGEGLFKMGEISYN
jgi:DNA repair protein RadA/Sms